MLVTGGTGFLGIHLVQALLKSNARVRVTVHRRPLAFEDPDIEAVHADLTVEEDCISVMKGVDYVFHAAGAVGSAAVSPADSMSGIATNLSIVSRLLHAAWSQNVSRLLIPSSSTVYPPADYPIKEEEAWNGPTYPAYFGYGSMKRYIEQLCAFVSAQSNIKIAIVRPTAPYGEWDNFDPATNHVVPALIQKAVEKRNPYQVWGSGAEVRDFLHISDLAKACLLALEKYAECDPVNIGSGEAVSIKDLVSVILKAAGHSGAQVEFDTTKPTTAPIRMVDTSKAKQVLGFTPAISLPEGISNTVQWYRETVGVATA